MKGFENFHFSHHPKEIYSKYPHPTPLSKDLTIKTNSVIIVNRE
jgi:hypothetical protein